MTHSIFPHRCLFVPLVLFMGGCSNSTRNISVPAHATASDVPQGSELGKALLTDTARVSTSAGAGALSVLAFGAGIAGDSIDAFAFVPKSRCALLFARSTESIQDLDLSLYGDDGVQFALDEASDNLPTLIICPNDATRLYATARIAQGEGLVALGFQEFTQREAEGIRRAVGARGMSDQPAELKEAWPGLEAATQARRRAVGGRWSDLRRVALPMDARVPTRLGATIPKENCLDLLLLPGEGVSGVGLVLRDREDRIFARAREAGEERYLLVCAEGEAQTVSIELRPRAGRGLAVLAMSSLTDPKDRLNLRDNTEIIRLGSAQPTAKSAGPLSRRLELSTGEISSFSYSSQGCSRLDLVAEDSLTGIDARAWDNQGQLLARSLSSYSAPFFVCAKGEVRIDLEARERGGPVAIYLASLKGLPQDLPNTPLAASRLLADLQGEGLALISGREHIKQATLQSTRLFREELFIRKQRCQFVLAAKDEGIGNIELRIMNGAEQLEEAFSRGINSASTTICAPAESDLEAVVELRVTEGSARALWMTRLLEP